MAIVKKGTLSVVLGGAAQNLNLGFKPSHFRMVNKTKLAAGTNGVVIAEWFDDMSDADAWIWTTSAGDGTNKITIQDTNGFTPFQTADGSLWPATNLTITGISVAASAVVTATNSLAVGDIVSFHGIVGMIEMNTLVGTVTAASGANFTVDIDSSNFTAWSSGGIANVIDGVNYGINSSAVQGNAGQTGLTLGLSLMVTTSDVWEYVAELDAPFTS